MRVEVFTAASVFRDLQTEWLQLLSQMPFQSVFLTPQWQSTWWYHFGGGHQLHVLTVRSDDGELQGLAPLMFEHGTAASPRLALIGDLELCDYLDLLIRPAWQYEVGQALVHYLVSQIGEETELCLTNLAWCSLTPALLHDRLAAEGLAVEIDRVETCPTITLPADWDAYLATLRGKDRHEMRRKIRRAMADAQLEYMVTSNGAELDEHLETFFALHRMSRQHAKRDFMTAAKAAFFRDMAHRLWSRGWIELTVLHADQVPVAALCCFTYGTTYAAYNASYHPDYGHLSVGIVLFANRIQSAIARRFADFDFLRGDEDYKYRFGATDRPLYQLLARAACPLPEACR
ncbi:MAG TPA: GNAT family N-acetyltransferase [Candidatus Tectomicrobia bacterium]|jgi:CelD/BcsL family acetyltransferase involved in cellulose biosynthesis